MDDNMSTRSSESSITTSGEYEIVTDSNVTTPLKGHPTHTLGSVASELLALHAAGSKSPTLAIANNRNISDLQHEMTDALRELELEKEWSAVAVSGSQMVTTTNATTRTAAGTSSTTSELRKQKALTLPLQSTSSPSLIVPAVSDDDEDENEEEERPDVAPDTLAATGSLMSIMKTQSLNRQRRTVIGDNMQAEMANTLTPTPKSEEAYSSEHQRVGQSVFYDCIDASPAASCVDDHRGEFKPEKNDTDDEVSEIDQGCTIFSGVTYLGAAKINAPKSELDVYRIMSELTNGSTAAAGLKISISIPNCSDGLVVLYDARSNTVIATYEIQSIILYFRGPVETVEHGCFAFTWLLGESLFQCHVFRCHIPEAVNQVSACFQKAFLTYPPSMTCSLTSAMDSNMINSVTSDQSGNPLSIAGYEFIVSLEIREKVAKNSYSAVPRDRNCFKLRAHTDKEVCIIVKQTPSAVLQPLLIERCFGVLLSPGKLVRQADMQLIEMVCMGYKQPSTGNTLGDSVSAAANTATAVPAVTPLCLNPYYIRAEWKASDNAFEQLNVESSKTYLTVAVNIVMRGIKEPVRFVIETPVTIQSQGELRIMDHFISKRPMMLRFYLHLKRATDEFSWEVSSIDPSEEITEPSTTSSSSSYLLKFGMNNLSRIVRSSSIVSIEDECHTDYSSDGDEPLLSGTGEVSKDCSQDTLDEWDPILKEWDGEKRPKNMPALVRLGVPEALREKVWQKLANVDGKIEMNDMYKTLIIKETKCETVIQRDIHRTFPAHKCFKESGGSGQDALFKVSKAYAVYDSEVGYCQGLSFIAASLLLHMPEEDAFCVLVALMYDYKLRDLYKHGFEVLYLRLYQLDHLIKDQLPKLHEHFFACGIETHMYASQWFLTLFTARFPLCFVFHVLDVFLLDGVPLLFQVALTLLGICEADLRQLDFEGILKYFRVTLPKKCRSASQARRIMKMACERKIKKLKHYEEEFLLKKQHKERLEKESQVYEKRFGEERRKLQAEVEALQQQLCKANERAVDKEKKHTGITHDYKQIIQRLEHDMITLNETLGTVMSTVSKCHNCAQYIELTGVRRDGGSSQESAAALSRGDHGTPRVDSEYGAGISSGVATLGPLDPLNVAMQRIRELEMELAQAKLAQVEAECKNQDLNHQLSTTLTEMQTNRNSWQPWLSKTFNTLQEKVTTRSGRDAPAATFQSYMSQQLNSATSPTDSETNSPSSNQEFKAFALNSGSPKLSSKFQQTGKLRHHIDSLRNIVAPLDTATVTSAAPAATSVPVPSSVHHEQSQP